MTAAAHSLLGTVLLLDSRQWGLVATWAGVSLAAAALAVLLGTLIGLRLATVRSRAGQAAWAVLALWPILIPPYVYAYLVGLMTAPEGPLGPVIVRLDLGYAVNGVVRTVLALGCWLSAVPAIVIGAGWRRWAGPTVRLAALEMGAWRAAWLGLRAAAPLVAIAALACLALACADVSVAHLCGLLTWQTELLLQASLAVPWWKLAAWSWPLAVPALLAGGLVFWLVSAPDRGGVPDGPDDRVAPAPRGIGLAATLAVTLTVVLPLLMVLFSRWQEGLPAAVQRWLINQGPAVATTLTNGLVAGVLSVALAASLPGRTRVVVTALWVLIGLLPPAVIGQVLLAHQQAWLELTHWRGLNEPLGRMHLVAIGVLRYGWVASAALLWAERALPAGIADLARLDARSRWQRLVRVDLPLYWPAALGGAGLVALLGLGEATASQLVLPPGVACLPISLLNEMHYGRRSDLMAACLVLTGVAVVAAVLGVLAAGRYRVERGPADRATPPA